QQRIRRATLAAPLQQEELLAKQKGALDVQVGEVATQRRVDGRQVDRLRPRALLQAQQYATLAPLGRARAQRQQRPRRIAGHGRQQGEGLQVGLGRLACSHVCRQLAIEQRQ